MQDVEWAAERFALLGRYLKDAGEGGLKRQLQKNITDAAKPLARKISDVEHLKPYFPDRYAVVLATDLGARVSQRFSGSNPGVMIRAKARERKRKLVFFDKGFINHPIYARGERKTWKWDNGQTGGMRPGFFSGPCKDATPDIRAKVLQAIAETERQITEGR